MKATQLGIWMDHQNAYLMEFTTDPIETKTIQSKFTHEAKEKSLHQGESHMHSKEQHQQAEYYRALGKVIKNYEEVILFGPTDAKTELFNLLTADHLYSKIKIKVKQADKMSEGQQHAYIKDYFSKAA
jgi:nitrogenase subunit NifH